MITTVEAANSFPSDRPREVEQVPRWLGRQDCAALRNFHRDLLAKASERFSKSDIAKRSLTPELPFALLRVAVLFLGLSGKRRAVPWFVRREGNHIKLNPSISRPSTSKTSCPNGVFLKYIPRLRLTHSLHVKTASEGHFSVFNSPVWQSNSNSKLSYINTRSAEAAVRYADIERGKLIKVQGIRAPYRVLQITHMSSSDDETQMMHIVGRSFGDGRRVEQTLSKRMTVSLLPYTVADTSTWALIACITLGMFNI